MGVWLYVGSCVCVCGGGCTGMPMSVAVDGL